MSSDGRLDATLRLLTSIDASLKQIVKQMARSTLTGVSVTATELAPDADLDSPYGDPVLKFMPRDWTGDSYKGRRYSECPPELLDLVAQAKDYFAEKAEASGKETASGKPVAPFERKDAARARGWAKRLRARGVDHREDPQLDPAYVETQAQMAWASDWDATDEEWR